MDPYSFHAASLILPVTVTVAVSMMRQEARPRRHGKIEWMWAHWCTKIKAREDLRLILQHFAECFIHTILGLVGMRV